MADEMWLRNSKVCVPRFSSHSLMHVAAQFIFSEQLLFANAAKWKRYYSNGRFTDKCVRRMKSVQVFDAKRYYRSGAEHQIRLPSTNPLTSYFPFVSCHLHEANDAIKKRKRKEDFVSFPVSSSNPYPHPIVFPTEVSSKVQFSQRHTLAIYWIESNISFHIVLRFCIWLFVYVCYVCVGAGKTAKPLKLFCTSFVVAIYRYTHSHTRWHKEDARQWRRPNVHCQPYSDCFYKMYIDFGAQFLVRLPRTIDVKKNANERERASWNEMETFSMPMWASQLSSYICMVTIFSVAQQPKWEKKTFPIRIRRCRWLFVDFCWHSSSMRASLLFAPQIKSYIRRISSSLFTQSKCLSILLQIFIFCAPENNWWKLHFSWLKICRHEFMTN